jgi:ketosteroid isomerase-like protein
VNDRQTIEQRRAAYVDGFNREDIAAMERCVSEDIVSMAPNRPATRGIEAQRAAWSEGFAAAKSLLFIFPEELEVLGEFAIDRHRWVLESMPKRGGRPVHDEGKCIWIWRRHADSEWKVARAIWNSDFSQAAFASTLGGDLSDDLAALNRILDRFVQTVNDGDAQGWGDLMTEDFIFAVPDAPRFVGKETAVAAAKAAFFDPFVLRLANKFEDVQIFGSQAFAHGVFTLALLPRSGGKMLSAPGKFTNFFRKQSNGSWKYSLVIFSYDQPPS